MINAPYETKSDSFYFVGQQLIMHNKAEYDYSPFTNDDIWFSKEKPKILIDKISDIWFYLLPQS